jgi:hypothetical protein
MLISSVAALVFSFACRSLPQRISPNQLSGHPCLHCYARNVSIVAFVVVVNLNFTVVATLSPPTTPLSPPSVSSTPVGVTVVFDKLGASTIPAGFGGLAMTKAPFMHFPPKSRWDGSQAHRLARSRFAFYPMGRLCS